MLKNNSRLMSGNKRKSKVYFFKNAKGKRSSVKTSEIDRAINHLQKTKKKVKNSVENKRCKSMRCLRGMESELALHCRQLPSVAYALRNAILRQDWKEVVVFTSLLCQPGITRYASVIIRSCLILLFNHPKSDIHLMEKFIRSCTGYTSAAEITKFIKILFYAREDLLPVLRPGKYIRSGSLYRIVDDTAFKDL